LRPQLFVGGRDSSYQGRTIVGTAWKIALAGLSGCALGAAGMAAFAAQTAVPPAYYVGNVQW
jgi:hypothetical protein